MIKLNAKNVANGEGESESKGRGVVVILYDDIFMSCDTTMYIHRNYLNKHCG